MKKMVIVFSILAAIGIVFWAAPVFANEEHGLRVGFSSSPRFPIVGQEATLTFTISFGGDTPGAGQAVMVMIMKAAAGGHEDDGHEEEGEHAEKQETPKAPAAGGHDMANMNGKEEEEAEMIHLVPEEISPGVYQGKVTFEHGGRYKATVSVLDDHVDVIIGVRESPVAWWYVGGLAGIAALLAGVVAVMKTVRRTW